LVQSAVLFCKPQEGFECPILVIEAKVLALISQTFGSPWSFSIEIYPLDNQIKSEMAVLKLRNVFRARLLISIYFGQTFAQQGCPDTEYAVDQSYNYGDLASGLPLLEYTSPYPIVGAPFPDKTSPVPVRQKIRDLEKNTDLWTLFILGLDKLQSVDQQDPLSWYQIGGILKLES
jgi:hypothetical protein